MCTSNYNKSKYVGYLNKLNKHRMSETIEK